MVRIPYLTVSSRCTIAATLGLVALPAFAGKSLPKDLAAYLQEQETTLPGITEAVSEHVMTTELRDGTPCDKVWSKNVKKAGGAEALMGKLGSQACFRKPLQAYILKRDKEIS